MIVPIRRIRGGVHNIVFYSIFIKQIWSKQKYRLIDYWMGFQPLFLFWPISFFSLVNNYGADSHPQLWGYRWSPQLMLRSFLLTATLLHANDNYLPIYFWEMEVTLLHCTTNGKLFAIITETLIVTAEQRASPHRALQSNDSTTRQHR